MKKHLFYIVLILFSLNCVSQNVIFKGNKKFSATEQWTFQCSLEAGIGNLDVQIARNEVGGYLNWHLFK